MSKKKNLLKSALPLLSCWAALVSVKALSQTEARDHSVAVGGSMFFSNVVNSYPPEALTKMRDAFSKDLKASNDARASAEQRAGEMAEKWHFSTEAISEFFRIIGEEKVPDERISFRLVEVATHYSQTWAQIKALDTSDPQTAELAAKASADFSAGHLLAADQEVDQCIDAETPAKERTAKLELVAKAASERHALAIANLLAIKADISITRLHYGEGAQRYAAAAAAAPDAYIKERRSYQMKQAQALYDNGNASGDLASLREAANLWHEMASNLDRKSQLVEWAQVTIAEGKALRTIGELESGDQTLEKSAVLLSSVSDLIKTTAQRDIYIDDQTALGDAFERIGEHTGVINYYRQSITAYQLAMGKLTSTKDSENAEASLHAAIGTAYSAIEGSGGSVDNLDLALKELTVASEKYDRQRRPFDWAVNEGNIANCLQRKTYYSGNKEYLEQAVQIYDQMAEIMTQAAMPKYWAQTQFNKAGALVILGERDSDAAKLSEAADMYDQALKVYTKDSAQFYWAMSMGEKGVALVDIGQIRGSGSILDSGIVSISSALTSGSIKSPDEIGRLESATVRARALLGRQ